MTSQIGTLNICCFIQNNAIQVNEKNDSTSWWNHSTLCHFGVSKCHFWKKCMILRYLAVRTPVIHSILRYALGFPAGCWPCACGLGMETKYKIQKVSLGCQLHTIPAGKQTSLCEKVNFKSSIQIKLDINGGCSITVSACQRATFTPSTPNKFDWCPTKGAKKPMERARNDTRSSSNPVPKPHKSGPELRGWIVNLTSICAQQGGELNQPTNIYIYSWSRFAVR